MTRIHGLVLSLLLTAAAVLGAYATMSTAHIGAASRPRAATAAELRARSVRLDKWSKSLDRALGSKPARKIAANVRAAAAVELKPTARHAR